MADINRFFRPIERKINIPQERYAVVESCIAIAEATARETNGSIYIIDYLAKSFLYVSPNPLFLCGHGAEEVKGEGYNFYAKAVPDEELRMLMEINEAGFRFYYDLPKEERVNNSIEYDFHLRYPNGSLKLIHHRLTPILTDEEGNMWLWLCSVSLSSAKQAGNVVFSCHDSRTRYAYSFETKRWKQMERVNLDEREKDILRLSLQGLKMAEIADRMCISQDTVKYHKRKLFQKLQADNIVAAVSHASALGVI